MHRNHRLMQAHKLYKENFCTHGDVWKVTGLHPNDQAEMIEAGTFPACDELGRYRVDEVEKWMHQQAGLAPAEDDVTDRKLARALARALS
jgi:hypothetical protein